MIVLTVLLSSAVLDFDRLHRTITLEEWIREFRTSCIGSNRIQQELVVLADA